MTADTAPPSEGALWDGVPKNPERDGWHWVRYNLHAYYEPEPWEWFDGRWAALMEFNNINGWPGSYEYLGPVLAPTDRDALQQRVRELEAKVERLENDLEAEVSSQQWI